MAGDTYLGLGVALMPTASKSGRLPDQSFSATQHSWRQALVLSLPALVLVCAILLPFLGSGFTIDDTFYLREAQQALHTPLRPSAAPIVWDGGPRLSDLELPMSAYTPVGP